MNSRKNRLLAILFAVYGLIMLWLLFGQRLRWVHYDNYTAQLRGLLNLIPFRTVLGYLRDLGDADSAVLCHAIINNGGNIATFVPLGFFLPACVKGCRGFWCTVLLGGATVICVEILQLFTLLGSCDIDDLILNLVGIALGYGIYLAFEKITKRSEKTL